MVEIINFDQKMVEILSKFFGRELSPLYFPLKIFVRQKKGRIYLYFRPTKFDRKLFRPDLVEIINFDR